MTTGPAHELVVHKNVGVPMRDGASLVADVYLPGGGGAATEPLPTILGRTTYDKENDWLWVKQVADFFTSHGYAVVVQDVRGRGESSGTGDYFHIANPREGVDGYDTVQWIAEQEWSNGRVGTVGSSHGGIVQQAMALHRPPALQAIWPDAAPTSNYHHNCREGGAMKLMMFSALFLHAHDAQELRDDPVGHRTIEDGMIHMRSLVCQQPLQPGRTPLAAVPNLEKTLFNYYYRGEYDEWWQQEAVDQRRYFDRHADIPGVFSGGWYDPYSDASTDYFATMTRQNSTPQRLVMGPWTHYGIFFGYRVAGNVDLGETAAWGFERYNAERLRWFDRWLKDVHNGIEDEPPVELFVMGGGDGRRTPEGRLMHGGAWRTERQWPLARTDYTDFYLRSSGGLTTEPPEEGATPRQFLFDPRHPVPAIAGSVAGFFEVTPTPSDIEPFFLDWVPAALRMRNIVMDGGAHQKEEPWIVGAQSPYPLLAARPDVLVFETDPLAEEVEITGPVEVVLWVASSAVDTDFTAKLVDVYPPSEDYSAGYHLNLVDSILRTRYRHGWDEPRMLGPGEPTELRLLLPPTCNVFGAGHRIRLDVSSSNFPIFDVNPNTGEPVGRHTRMERAHQTVFADRDRPSRVILPVIPCA